MTTHIYYSNTIERLAEQFAADITIPGPDPLLQPMVIVPNPHLKKWLQLRVAGINGIAANCDFQFLDQGLWKIITRLSSTGNGESSMLQQEELRLMIFHVLNSGIESGDLAPLKSYYMNMDGTGKPHASRRTWRLSERLTRIFNGYELFREPMIRAWENDSTLYGTPMETAQKYLYQALFGKNGLVHSVRPGAATLRQYADSSVIKDDCPGTTPLYLFGKSQLSPLHTRIIYELGSKIDLMVYQLNPCSEFWEDVSTPGEERWGRIKNIPVINDSEGESLGYDENENPLLKMWGKSGRETTRLLSMIEDAGSREQWLVSDWLVPETVNDERTVLGTLKEHILQRSSGGPDNFIPNDTSVQVSACPDIYREAEGVYNSILYNLTRDPSLSMTDIAVMVPDMELYGPVLESVFSRRPERIAFSMIDRSAAADSRAAAAARSILAVADGSFSREELFRLIMNPCFLEASGSTAEQAGLWLSWVDSLNIYSGYDTDDRNTQGSGKSYTWKHGLQRLRLGRIMDVPVTGQDTRAFLDYREVVPFSDMTTGNNDQTGDFSMVVDLIYSRVRSLRHLNTRAGEWAPILRSLFSDFIAVPAGMEEESLVLSQLDRAISRLEFLDIMQDGDAGTEVDLEFIIDYISESLSSIPGSRGSYLNSGVNISSLVPKRQIPFRIIYIMGMQEGLFPGTADLSTLDLRNFKRTIGDISKPDANRYLFLETLISARERLYITYTSKDLKKDQDFYPNSVVSQLIDYVSTSITGSGSIISGLPLSGSSPGYLHASGPHTDFFSLTSGRTHMPVNYSEPDMLLMYLMEMRHGRSRFSKEAADAILKKKKSLTPDFSFTAENRPSPAEETERISLRELARFLENPAESMIRRHLGLYDRERDTVPLEKGEPLFSGFPFNTDIVSSALAHHVLDPGDDVSDYVERVYANARLRGETPDGSYAEIDSRYFSSLIQNRLAGDLGDLIRELHRGDLFIDPSFGSNVLRPGKDCCTGPVSLTAETSGRAVPVELSGSVRYLFKNAPGNKCQILVLTTTSDFRPRSIIEPFLFYITARSGLNTALYDMFGTGGCTIHVSHMGGIESFSYDPAPDRARSYIENLVRDFLDQDSPDMLPVNIISDQKKMTSPAVMKPDAPVSEKADYRAELINRINHAIEDSFTYFSSSAVLADLIEPEVPVDAYDKVYRRFHLLLGPLLKEKKK